jgi:hypothetical protein
MQGRRIYPPPYSELKLSDVQPGDYWLDSETETWMCRVPNGHFGGLKNHSVTDHGDGTITVSPSILVTGYDDEKGENATWHGYLEKGIWREA